MKVTITKNKMYIPELNFSSTCCNFSSSKEWCIACSAFDFEFQSGMGGCRERGHGLYVLYNIVQEKIILRGQLERPWHGHVADNGFFSIEDRCFGQGLKGIFYVISPTGKTIIKKELEANIHNSMISENGKYAVCQTAHNPESEDGNLLTAFNVNIGEEIFSITPVTGWADKYIFDEAMSKFGVVHYGIGTYYYNSLGIFLDKESYEQEKLICEKYEIVIVSAEDILNSPNFNSESALTVIKAIDHALSILSENEYHYESWACLAFKIKGLAYEFLENKTKALQYFDKAISLNPKVGLKRKAEKLRKELS